MTEPPVTGGTEAHTARFPTETPPAAASGHVTAGGGLPLLEDVPAWLTARITLRQRIGDHLLVVGEVESGAVAEDAPALVHHDGAFAAARRLPSQ
ncbi:flavin reductase family protein [Streptomyces sp. H27-G5]|uniref:flavin reductase family protein n=1 Tax=Streptomyces sp. H27-G5 TaxID=2996698 RepID=UPI0022715790|nr:flavin reductase family protein [Streptomyces sp. H27-G5]MCY0919379.1 flavin reductase family protein [Streptomyces sp. H27-G5]